MALSQHELARFTVPKLDPGNPFIILEDLILGGVMVFSTICSLSGEAVWKLDIATIFHLKNHNKHDGP